MRLRAGWGRNCDDEEMWYSGVFVGARFSLASFLYDGAERRSISWHLRVI